MDRKDIVNKDIDKKAFEWLENRKYTDKEDLSLCLHYNVWNNKYRNGNETFDQWLDRVSNKDEEIRTLILDKKFLFGGRILANRGVADSGSYSNCYSLGFIEDSIEGVFTAAKDLAHTFKSEGGQGLSLSKIRPKGCLIKGKHESDGILPFMRVFNTTVGSISQGNSRRGALLMSLDIWHKEASNFIKIKSDLNEINNANLSLEIDDEFMQLVSDYYDKKLQDKPIKHVVKEYSGNKIEYDVDVIALYKELCKHAREYAEPGILFVSPYRNYILAQHHSEYKIETGNACVTGETLILTKEGYRPIIECVDKPTTIWNGFGWSEVIPKITGENKKIYKITFSDGSVLHCTDNHKFRLSDGTDVMTKNLNLSNTYKLQKCEFPVIIGEKSIEEKVAYTQGFFTGDGWISSSNIPIISLFDKKKELLQYFTYTSVWENENYPEIRLNLNPTLNFNKNFIPDSEYSIQTRLDWLAGYLDSDGTVHKAKHGGVSISSIDKERLNKIKLMLNTLGINPSVSLMRKEGVTKLPKNNGTGEYAEYNTKKCYRLLINKYDYFNLVKLGLKTHRINIGDEKLPNRSARRFITINSIEATNRVETVYCFNEPINHTAIFNGVYTCQCSEQSLPKHGACNLCSFNLYAYVKNPFTDDAYFDKDSFENDIPKVVRAMDDILDENLNNHPLYNQKAMSYDYRNIGIGFMGLADAFMALGYTYGDKNSVGFTQAISKLLFRTAVEASSQLASTKGRFPKYEESIWESDIIKNAFTDKEIKEYKAKGLRNVALLSIAPTGSIGTMLGLSTGIEPEFALSYKRRTLSLNGKETVYKEDAKIVKDYKNIVGNPNASLPSYIITSYDIPWKDRIAVQAAAQKYIDTAISSTCNLPKNTTAEEVEQIYLEAWRQGLKGFTIYRDGSRDPILFTEDSSIKTIGIVSTKAPERPKELPADFHLIKYKGEQFTVAVGLLEDKPYEIFAFRMNIIVNNMPSHKGKIIRNGSDNYSFVSDYINIKNLAVELDNMEEKANTIYPSLALRNGVSIEEICKTMGKLDDNIASFSASIIRVLRKYEAAKELEEKCPKCGSKVIREGGCKHCSNMECSWSACGD